MNSELWDGRGELENGCKGPILLYTGNEGDVTGFWDSNGFMINVLAPKWGALLLFPEVWGDVRHRMQPIWCVDVTMCAGEVLR